MIKYISTTKLFNKFSNSGTIQWFMLMKYSFDGRAIAQADSYQFPTPLAWVRSQAMSCGICTEQCSNGAEFLCVLWFPCQFSFHHVLHTHLSSGAATIGQLVSGVLSGLSLTPPHEIKKKNRVVNHNGMGQTGKTV
jgi:hypothetical protein